MSTFFHFLSKPRVADFLRSFLLPTSPQKTHSLLTGPRKDVFNLAPLYIRRVLQGSHNHFLIINSIPATFGHTTQFDIIISPKLLTLLPFQPHSSPQQSMLFTTTKFGKCFRSFNCKCYFQLLSSRYLVFHEYVFSFKDNEGFYVFH